MSEAGFDLRKWETNHKELRAYITFQESCQLDTSPRADDTTYSKTTCNSSVEETKHSMVLGLEWDTIADEFVFRFDNLLSRCSAVEQTKRNLLRVSASIYDPLGLIAPITARIKTIFQILWKDKLNWDDIIPPNIALVWNEFLVEAKRLREIRLQRCVFDLHFPSKFRFELHGFSDSSLKLYYAVVYLRFVSDSGIKVSLLASKTKVAPLKKLTIRRLEWLECLLLIRLIKRCWKEWAVVLMLVIYTVGRIRKTRYDLAFNDSRIESLFVEICRPRTKNIIVGIVYRPPDQRVDEFIKCNEALMMKVSRENKVWYLMGDYNLNLLNYENHQFTSEFLDIMYSCMFVPLISRPTRITSNTATLIDNIFSNNLENHAFRGLFFTDISDHSPVFTVTLEEVERVNTNSYNSNIDKFHEYLRNIVWSDIPEYNDRDMRIVYFWTNLQIHTNHAFH